MFSKTNKIAVINIIMSSLEIKNNLQKKYLQNIYIIEMNKILDVVEDIKQKITDNEYKIIMDSLMEINKMPFCI